MTISREEQSKRAQTLLPLVDAATTTNELERLYEDAKKLLTLAGWDDNGIAFDLSEYTYERLQTAMDEKHSDEWAKAARASLVSQLS